MQVTNNSISNHDRKQQRKVRVAAVQFEHKSNDKRANFEKIKIFVEKAAQKQVEIIVFPECCLTGYWHLRHLDRSSLVALAEPVPHGPMSQQLIAISKESRMIVGTGLVEITEHGNLYNTYVVALPNGNIYAQRKLHAFVNENISSGQNFTVFDSPFGWRIGILICYDNNIIENGRMMGLMGVDILLAPHQTGGCSLNDSNIMGMINRSLWDNRVNNPDAIENEFKGPKGREWLMRWLPSRAHDQGLFLIFSNGVGVDDDEIRTGNAMILDPYGRILVETWQAGDYMVVADLDSSMLASNTGRQWMKARKPELYNLLTQPIGIELDTRKVRFSQ